jgi:hypothetical protein
MPKISIFDEVALGVIDAVSPVIVVSAPPATLALNESVLVTDTTCKIFPRNKSSVSTSSASCWPKAG